MVRTQIQLTEQQTQRLKALAKERGVSMAELIRQSVDTLLESSKAIDPEERKRMLLSIVGIAGPDVPDLSINHDYYLEQAYEG
jgi:Ribbon-helix-helix protein, copG family